MGVEHGGSDKGPETGDKPTKPDSASGPPPDNPGSPGQQSRIESLKAAGWNVNGQQESGSERGQNNNESSSTGSSEENASAAPKTEKGTGSETGSQLGDGKSEPGRPKPETGEAAPRDEGKGEPRTTEPGERHPKANAEPQSTSERNGEAANNTEPLGDKDIRTEFGDKPRADDSGKPPTETPESTRPMTRRESLQNAGWDLRDPPASSTDQPPSQKMEQNGTAQEGRDGRPATSAGSLDVGEGTPEDKPAPPAGESDTPQANEGSEASDKPEPKLSETGLQVEQSTEGHPRDSGIPAGDLPTGDSDQPHGQTPEDHTGSRSSDTEPSQEKDQKPEAPETPPPAEPPRGTDKPTAETPDTDPQPATPDTTNTPKIAEDGARAQEQRPPATEDKPENAPADQVSTSDLPHSPTETADHDKKAGKAETADPVEENTKPDRETEEPGRELSTHEEKPPETEPNPYRARITLRRDSDGNFIQERRFDDEDDTPGRAEPRNPEDDPEFRDYQESDLESRSRIRDFMREFTSRAEDIRDSVDKTSEPAQKNFEEVRPTGQLCGSRPAEDQMKPPDNTVKGGSLVLAAAGGFIIVTEVGRVGLRTVQHMRGRENAGNR
ncbi:hypothetical protein [Actinomadura madurae]|uniref:hypothetical protein n=2 Tax=Actinomadura madurae TaxID=1993 RepID=UPI0020D25321|nr:hypothetical protein [Actinomadura madurae]MCQ0010577.1 hypothetical protein [Actinomadura madurae]